jgi:hypothetical protein
MVAPRATRRQDLPLAEPWVRKVNPVGDRVTADAPASFERMRVSAEHEHVDLVVVGLSEDHGLLVLIDEDGQTFAIPVDDATSAIAGRSPARTASRYATATENAGRSRSAEDPMSNDALRPRDIQARIRAGASVEDVIAESGMERDHVERYAGPMLAERDHVATLARTTEIRRDMASDVSLSRAVAERLTPLGVDESSADWDAWRREDGRWVVRIAYTFGREERRGHWVFDPRARSLVVDDAEARWLIDPAAPEPADGERATKPRLAAVVALGGAPTGAAPMAEPAPTEDIDDPEIVRELTAEVDRALERLDERTAGLPELTEQVQATLDELADEEDASDASTTQRSPRPAKRKGRASVPSWDDIVFGSRKPQD